MPVNNNKWNSFWFGNNLNEPKLSLGFIRIAVHLCVLFFLCTYLPVSYSDFIKSAIPELYKPIGIAQLLGNHLFSSQFYEGIRVIALLFTFTAILGLFTRVSMVISCFSSMILASFYYYTGKWSHGVNVIFLAQLAIAFSPAGKAISIDALINKRSSLSSILKWLSRNKGNTNWPVRLAEIAVALMFFNAAFFKWSNDPLTFGWVFSDNLRNMIGVRFLATGLTIPSYLTYVSNHSWAWKTLAAGNMISQTMPMLACFMHRYPKTRLVLGVFFMFEIIGLGFFAQLWFPAWFLLYTVFIDWEFFLGKRFGIAEVKSQNTHRAASIYTTLFLLLYVSVGFNPKYGLQEILRPYPFSRFPMFANMVTEKPYREHKPAEMAGIVFEVKNKGVVDSTLGITLQQSYYNTIPADISFQKSFLPVLSSVLPAGTLPDTIKWERAIVNFTAYPQPLKLIVKQRGLIGEISADGRIKTASVEYKNSGGGFLSISSIGYNNPEIEVKYINNFKGEPLPLKGRWDVSHTKYYLEEKPKGNNLFVLAIKGDNSPLVDIYFGGGAIF